MGTSKYYCNCTMCTPGMLAICNVHMFLGISLPALVAQLVEVIQRHDSPCMLVIHVHVGWLHKTRYSCCTVALLAIMAISPSYIIIVMMK